MRAALIIVAAILFGLAGGYGSSAWSRPAPKPKHYKATMLIPADAPETADDKAWAARATYNGPIYAQGAPDPTLVEQSVTYSGCDEVRAAGRRRSTPVSPAIAPTWTATATALLVKAQPPSAGERSRSEREERVEPAQRPAGGARPGNRERARPTTYANSLRVAA